MNTVPLIKQSTKPRKSSAVKTIIETALASSVSYWVTIAENGVEQFPRKLVYFEPDGRGEVHFNASAISFGPAGWGFSAEASVFAKSKDGAPIKVVPLTFNGNPGPARIGRGDKVQFQRGHIRIAGRLP